MCTHENRNIHHQVFQLERQKKKKKKNTPTEMRAFQLLAPLLLVSVDVTDAAGDKDLNGGQRLNPGESITTTSSCNGRVLWLIFQTDGNLVYYARDSAGVVSVLWASDTVAENSADVDAAVMQWTDGNFVIYEKGGIVRWDAGTYPLTDNESNFLTVHADETLSIGNSVHPKKWTAGTACIRAPRPTPYPIPEVPGCYEGMLEHHHHRLSNGFDSENIVCQLGCIRSGYVYAAIYQGSDCYCGNSLTLKQLPDDVCFVRCYRSQEPCGGPGASTVFYVHGGGLFSASKTKQD